MHLVGFIIRIYHDAARSSECQIRKYDIRDFYLKFPNPTLLVEIINKCDKFSN